jgi:hypothetical protein
MKPGIVRAFEAHEINLINDGGRLQGLGEFEPLPSGSVGGGDGKTSHGLMDLRPMAKRSKSVKDKD